MYYAEHTPVAPATLTQSNFLRALAQVALRKGFAPVAPCKRFAHVLYASWSVQIALRKCFVQLLCASCSAQTALRRRGFWKNLQHGGRGRSLPCGCSDGPAGTKRPCENALLEAERSCQRARIELLNKQLLDEEAEVRHGPGGNHERGEGRFCGAPALV